MNIQFNLLANQTQAIQPQAQPQGRVMLDNVVNLSKGQILEAAVQRVLDNVAWLDVGGRRLIVRTEVPLQPQQQIWLEVNQVSQNRAMLSLLDPDAAQARLGEQARQSGFSPQSLNAWLANQGLATDAVNQRIGQALVQHAQMLNPTDVQQVRRNAFSLLGPNPAAVDLEALAYLQANRLPIRGETVVMARQFLQEALPVAGRLSTLNEAMTTLQTQLGQAVQAQNPATATTLTQVQQTLQQALTQTQAYFITPQTPPAEVPARLAALAQQLGTPPEAILARQVEGQAQPANTAAGAEAANPATRSEPPLMQLARALHQALSDSSLDAGTRQNLQHMSDQLQTLNRDLGSLHLGNLSNLSALHQAQAGVFTLPIPLRNEDGSQTAQLKIYRQPGQTEIDPGNVRLALLLSLPSLGDMVVNLQLVDQHLNGQILSERKETQAEVTQQLQNLIDRLSILGYHVDAFGSAALDIHDKPTLDASATPPEAIRLSKLDVSA